MTEKPVEGRRQARQQRRFNFRDSIGRFETSRLVVPQPCSSPSCHQNPAKRPSGQAQAWIATWIPRWPLGFLTTREPQSLWPPRLVCLVYICDILDNLPSLPSISSHLHASPKPWPALVVKTPNGTAYRHRLQHTFGPEFRRVGLLEILPLVH